MAKVAFSGRRRCSWWLLVLVFAAACGPADDMPSPPGSMAPSDGAGLQLRPVTEIVSRSSADWDETQVTCAGHGDGFRDCLASTLDAQRIVLLRPGTHGDKYVLGAVIVDGGDVERAIAGQDAQPGTGWIVYVDLTLGGAAAFEAATEAAVGSAIAIIIDGRILSSPIVAAPITSGDVVVASGLTEHEATSLASKIDPDRG
jgi:preprotein translocase subunit SecD